MQIIKRLIISIITVILIFSLAVLALPAPAQAATYSDIGNHWARDVIIRWESIGALADFPSGAFRPNTPITRAEFFSILVRAMDAEEMADISHFTDVSEDAWYYEIIAKANQMRIADGASKTTMKPTENIIRQDAATIVARTMGLVNENANYLYRYNDGGSISDYARNYVSAITEYGYMHGSYGNFNPRAYLSRAEAVKIVDNLFAHYYRPEVGFDNFTLSGNVLTTRKESVFNDLTIHGDLILADGVGDGNVTINNCVINGRLLVRGGGPNSIVLDNTRITGGITVISPGSDPRIATTGATSTPQLLAFSGFTLTGTGVHSVMIADDAFANINAVLQGVALDTAYVGGVGAKVDLREGRINNLHIVGAAESATCSLAQGTLVDHMSTVSPNTSLLGTGRVSDAFINAPGATLAMTPDTYSVGASLSAIFAGQTAAGQVLNTANTIARDSSQLAVSADSSRTGGEELRFSSARGRASNTVLITQTPYSKIPLEKINDRWGYYIGFFIPAPTGGRNSIDLLTYRSSDGGLVVMEDVSLTRKGGVYGLEFHIPVTRDGKQLRGQINEMLYIQWNNQNTENLQFHSGWLALEPLTSPQESRLIEQYSSDRFYGYDGTHYSGAEALQRLLASDNPLGLDMQGFSGFSAADQEDLAARLYELGNELDTKEKIQGMINQVVSRKAALYAVNNAVTKAQLRSALEKSDFAKELNIEVTSTSLYGLLSQLGKDRVSTVMLTARTKDYAAGAAVKTAFDKAVTDVRALELNLLVAMNAAKKPADAQKLVETKANADLLQFAFGDEPYKSLPNAMKLELGQRLLDNAPYYSVDKIAQVINDFLATITGVSPAVTITGIKVDPATISLLTGQNAKFTVTVITTTGNLTNYSGVTVTNGSPNIIDVDTVNYIITGLNAGSAKVAVSVTDQDTKKTFTATISVTVKVPVPSTSVTLAPKRVEVEEGTESTLLKATMLPANTTDTLSWSTLDATIATIRGTAGGNSIISALSPGLTNAVVRTSSGLTDTAQVVVVSKDPGVMVDPEEITIGIGQTYDKVEAFVSPLSIGEKNRGVRWTSEDYTVATVDPYGRVTGVDTGDTYIVATSIYFPNLSARCHVIVDDSIKQLTLNTRKAVMLPTGIEHLTATVIPFMEPTDKIIWGVRPVDASGTVAEAREIATVAADIDSDPLGDPMKATITAHRPGTVIVYAYLESDSAAMAECEVQVLSGNLTITFPRTLSLYAGDRLTTAIPAFNPSTITNKTIHWSINDTDIAIIERVNANGSITIYGKKGGTVKLTGEPEAVDNFVIDCTVTVSEIAVTTFSIVPNHIYMDVGNVINLTDPGIFSIRMLPANATNKRIEWTGDNSGRVSINNPPPTAADPYGPSTMEAVRTTYKTVDKQVANPDGTFNWVTEWVDDPMVLVAKAVGAANNVREVTILVSINPSDTNQVNNIKIALERWVYPVGVNNQYMTVHFNVTGRAANGDWELGLQPPNRKITWSSGNADIAYVTDDNRLVTLTPGKVDITATSQDSGRTDTVTIVVAPDPVESINYSGLDSENRYANGRLVEMTVGDTRKITATPSPEPKYDMPFIWTPLKWAYTNPASSTDMAGNTNGLAWDLLDLSADKTMTNTITALKPGLVKMELTLEEYYRVGSYTIEGTDVQTSLKALCASLGVDFGTCLKANGIIYGGTDANPTAPYYSPNEVGLTLPDPTGGPNINVSRPLSTTARLNLKVPYKMNEGAGEFFVWIHGKQLNSARFSTTAGLQLISPNEVKLTADIGPGPFRFGNSYYPTIVFDRAEWTITPSNLDILEKSTVAGSEGYDTAVGQYYGTFKVKNGVAAGTYTINVVLTVYTAEEDGFRSASGRDPQSWPKSSAATIPCTLIVEVPGQPSPMPPRQISMELQTPVETPAATDTTQPLVNDEPPVVNNQPPAVTPTPIEDTPPAPAPSYDSYFTAPDPATLLSPFTSKILKLRGSAIVTVGKSISLIPALSPGNYDLSSLVWVSNKPEIATVDDNGVVRGLKAGKAAVTVTLPGTKLKASCTVTVSAALKVPLSSINLSSSALTLEEGKASALKVSFYPTNATAKGVSWLSSDSSVATVDAAGKVAAIAGGSAVILAVSDDGGHIASCTVTVTPKPIRVTGVTLNCTTLPLMVGEQFTLEYSILPENAANQEVRWTTSNNKVVTVENGQLTALKKGSATITVLTADGNKRATCRVTVK